MYIYMLLIFLNSNKILFKLTKDCLVPGVLNLTCTFNLLSVEGTTLDSIKEVYILILFIFLG